LPIIGGTDRLDQVVDYTTQALDYLRDPDIVAVLRQGLGGLKSLRSLPAVRGAPFPNGRYDDQVDSGSQFLLWWQIYWSRTQHTWALPIIISRPRLYIG
jgi:hypothetical protein